MSTGGKVEAMHFEWQSKKTERAWVFDAMGCQDSLSMCTIGPFRERNTPASVLVTVTLAYGMGVTPGT